MDVASVGLNSLISGVCQGVDFYMTEAEGENRTEILGPITRDDYTGLSYRVKSCEFEFRVGGHRFCLSESRGFIYE